MFKVGKPVVALNDFSDVRRIWGFNYPYRGDVLIIRAMWPHLDMLMLKFDECEVEMCSRNFAPLEEIGQSLVEDFVLPRVDCVATKGR